MISKIIHKFTIGRIQMEKNLMLNRKTLVLILLGIAMSSCLAMADRDERGGHGNNGVGPPFIPSVEIPEQNFPQDLQIRKNDQREDLQPQQEQIKRDYNQGARELKHKFQQNWKNIKKSQ